MVDNNRIPCIRYYDPFADNTPLPASDHYDPFTDDSPLLSTDDYYDSFLDSTSMLSNYNNPYNNEFDFIDNYYGDLVDLGNAYGPFPTKGRSPRPEYTTPIALLVQDNAQNEVNCPKDTWPKYSAKTRIGVIHQYERLSHSCIITIVIYSIRYNLKRHKYLDYLKHHIQDTQVTITTTISPLQIQQEQDLLCCLNLGLDSRSGSSLIDTSCSHYSGQHNDMSTCLRGGNKKVYCQRDFCLLSNVAGYGYLP